MKVTIRKEKIAFFNGQENISILQISDTHIWFSSSILKKIEEVIALKKPDLILLTGDYYDTPKGATLFRTFLIAIAKKYTVAFIYGNHDKIYGSRVLNLLHNIPNCYCVENEIFRFKSKCNNIYNITSWKNRMHLQKKDAEKNIVLIHNPEKIKEIEVTNIDLLLAGHLHGGQFIFFTTKNGGNFPGCLVYNYCCDRTTINNTPLIVSKGLGDTLPIRINCPKEIVEISII